MGRSGSVTSRPGDLVALDSFYIWNLKGVGKVWQLTAVDTATRWAICEVFLGPSNTVIAGPVLGPRAPQTPPSRHAHHRRAHRQRSRVRFRFDTHLAALEIAPYRTPPR